MLMANAAKSMLNMLQPCVCATTRAKIKQRQNKQDRLDRKGLGCGERRRVGVGGGGGGRRKSRNDMQPVNALIKCDTRKQSNSPISCSTDLTHGGLLACKKQSVKTAKERTHKRVNRSRQRRKDRSFTLFTKYGQKQTPQLGCMSMFPQLYVSSSQVTCYVMSCHNAMSYHAMCHDICHAILHDVNIS